MRRSIAAALAVESIIPSFLVGLSEHLAALEPGPQSTTDLHIEHEALPAHVIEVMLDDFLKVTLLRPHLRQAGDPR